MSRQTAASPWWADVQHLRPREEREADERALVERTEGARRFGRRTPDTPRRGGHRDFEPRETRDRDAAPDARVPRELPADPRERAADPRDRAADPRDRAADRTDRARQAAREAASVVFAADVTAPAPRPAHSGSLADLLGPEPVSAPAPADEPAPVEDWLKPRHADARIENGRKTIEIRGQVDRVAGITAPAEVADGAGRRRPARRRADRIAGRPDRIALWAFLLGIVLILVAAFSDSEAAHGAVQALDAGRAATGR